MVEGQRRVSLCPGHLQTRCAPTTRSPRYLNLPFSLTPAFVAVGIQHGATFVPKARPVTAGED